MIKILLILSILALPACATTVQKRLEYQIKYHIQVNRALNEGINYD